MIHGKRIVGQTLAVALGVVTLGLVPLGCGAAQDDYSLVDPSERERPTQSGWSSEGEKAQLESAARLQAQACLEKHGQPWSRRTYDLRYDAQVNEDRAITEVKLRDTTLPEDVEGCLRQVIGTLRVPEEALRSRSSGPVSGGETMRREQRGPLGSNESQNPLVWGFAILLEAVELEVVVQVFVGAIAAVGTIATSKKDPLKDCLDKYVACQDTPLGKLQVDVWGTSVCESCRRLCTKKGAWPSGFDKAVGWQTCTWP